MKTKHAGIHERIDKINQLIKVIAGCGRNFLSHEGRVAYFHLWGNRLYFHTDYTNVDLPCYRTNLLQTNAWEIKFSQGGTLKSLVDSMVKYIRFAETEWVEGRSWPFGPWPDWYGEGDLWGYGGDMQIVRDEAKKLGLMRTA